MKTKNANLVIAASLILTTFGVGEARASWISGLKTFDLRSVAKLPRYYAVNLDDSRAQRFFYQIRQHNLRCQEAAQECIDEYPPVWQPESNTQVVTYARDIDRCIAEKEQGCEKVCEDARPGDPLQYPVQYEFPPESGVVHDVQCYDKTRIAAIFGYCLADTMTTTQVLESPDETAYYCFGGVTYDYTLYDLHRSTTGGDHACVLGEVNGGIGAEFQNSSGMTMENLRVSGTIVLEGSSLSFEDSSAGGFILLDGSSVSFEGVNRVGGQSTCIDRPGDEPTHRACLDEVQESDGNCIVTLGIESYL